MAVVSHRWSPWRPFPDPRRGESLVAPIGPGVYEVRNKRTGQRILFGIGRSAANRMTSLLPEPWGTGGRNSSTKRTYVLRQLRHLEYRTLPTATRREAAVEERRLKASFDYRFRT